MAVILADAPDIRAYLDRAGRQPFAFGKMDCAQFVAGWLEILTGASPARHAPPYAGEAEAVAMVRRLGGMRRLVEALALRHGLVDVEEPRLGDIGVVVLRGRRLLAISLGAGRWALKTRDGIATGHLRHVAAWRHGPGRGLGAEAIGAFLILAATGATATPFVAGVVGTVVIAALSIGAQYALSALAPKPKARAGGLDQGPPDAQAGQQTIRQAIGPRMRHYGRVKVGGTLVWDGVSGGIWSRVVAIGHGEIDSIEEHWLNSTLVTVVADAVQEAPFAGYAGLRWRMGLATETAYADLVSVYPTEWTSAHRGDGIASVWLALNDPGPQDFARVYAGGVPSWSGVLRGAKVYDPRDVAQDWDDPATWAWSDNSALVLLDFLTHADGFGKPHTAIDLESFTAFADICDEDVTLKAGGTEKRYRCSGSYALTEPKKTVLARILATCDGRIVQGADGSIGVTGGRYVAPEFALGPESILSTEWDFGADATARVNRLKPIYTDPANEFQETEAAAWEDVDAIALDGEIAEALQLSMVPSGPQAQRLAKISGRMRSAPRRGTVVANLAGIGAWQQSTIALDDGAVSGIFRVEKCELAIASDSIRVTLTVTEIDATIWDWDAATEEGDAPADPGSAGAAASIEVPSSLSVTVLPETLDATTIGGKLRATWSAPARPGMATEIRYRNVVGGTPGPYTSALVALADDGSYVTEWQSGVIANDASTYDVQARFRVGSSAPGEWCTAESVTATADATDPGVVTSLVLTGGAGQIATTFKLPNSANVAGARVYSNTSNTMTGATLKSTLYGAPGSSLAVTVTGLTAGTRWILVRAFNGSSVESASHTSGSAVVT